MSDCLFSKHPKISLKAQVYLCKSDVISSWNIVGSTMLHGLDNIGAIKKIQHTTKIATIILDDDKG